MFNRNTQNLNTVATEFSKYKILIFKQIIREYILPANWGKTEVNIRLAVVIFGTCGKVPSLFTELGIFCSELAIVFVNLLPIAIL